MLHCMCVCVGVKDWSMSNCCRECCLFSSYFQSSIIKLALINTILFLSFAGFFILLLSLDGISFLDYLKNVIYLIIDILVPQLLGDSLLGPNKTILSIGSNIYHNLS